MRRTSPHRGSAILTAAAALGVVTMLLVVACGGDDSGEVVAGDLTISHAVARFPSPNGNGAAYLTIENAGSEDTLLSAVSSIATMAQIHETVTEGAGSQMQPRDEVPVPAGGSLRLQPGGYHIMLMGVSDPPAAGDEFDLTLVFERAGTVVVTVEVADPAAVDDALGD